MISEVAIGYLKSWGFTEASPDFLLRHAETCAAMTKQANSSLIISNISGIPVQDIESAAKSNPANRHILEHIESIYPSVREHSLRITAIMRGIPFFEQIMPEWLDTIATVSREIRPSLDSYNAILIKSISGKPIVVFSDIINLLSFTQKGVTDKMEDPIRLKLGDEPGVALASSITISKAFREEEVTEAFSVASASNQDNLFVYSQAKTDAEKLLTKILDDALMKRATDIQFAPSRDGTSSLKFRIFGDMAIPDRNSVLSPDAAKEIINFLLAKSRAGDGGRLRKPADGQLTYKNSNVEAFIRASFIPADRSGTEFDMISVSLRLMPKTTRSIKLDQLNIPKVVTSHIEAALAKSQGLIVLAGPTNSGKSTTIAGIVGKHIDMYGNSRKRLSLEDPVERYLDGITQISVDNNFAELIRALLRHDPDMIWVGEIRDAFSAAACVRAATSGHVVLSTVHANDSILAFRAISNYLRKDTGEATGGGASLFDLAESISLLIGQRLVKKLCPHCKVKNTVPSSEQKSVINYLKSEGYDYLIDRANETFKHPLYSQRRGGCDKCDHSGYSGEIPVAEVLPGTREVRSIFSQSESRLDFNKLSKHRANTLVESAFDLIDEGLTDYHSLFI